MSNLRFPPETIGAVLIAGLLLSACVTIPGLAPVGTPTPAAGITPSASATEPPRAGSSSGGWLDWDGKGGWTGGPPRTLGEGVAGEESTMMEKEMAAPLAMDAEPAPAADTAPEPAATAAASDQQHTALRAGEVDDNAQWDDYLLYRLSYAGPAVHDRDVSERYVVTVTDSQGRPLLDAGVTFYADNEPVFSGRTYATGQILFFPKAVGVSDDVSTLSVVVEKDESRQETTLTRGEDYDLTVKLAHSGRAAGEPVALDVLFLIDSTGSMADEINKLQESIHEIAARIDRLPGQPQVRFGMTIYRDRGDLFVSRTFDFTPDVKVFHDALAEVEADGGGDTPESLNEGLYRAIHGPEWRGQDAVQLIFLVADAAPHLNYEQDYDYAVEMQTAAERGIKIFSIASSGLDDQGEYVFRQIAQFTQGRFIFLTYGPGGEPGDSTTHNVDDYSVQRLDELVVRLVEEELAFQQ